MADPKVKARIEAEDRASKTVEKVEGRFKRFGNFLKSRFVITLGDVTRLMRGLASVFTSTVGAAQVQEDAIRKLDAALVKLGPSAKAVSRELQEQAAALQKVTKYGDETIIAGQALIASFTDNAEQIKGATAAALDLAAATGTNLQSAFLLLGRAAAGETSMLSRYGITLDEGIPKSEKFAAALVKINEQFGGQAQAQAKTFSGLVAQISNSFGDLKEKVGESITENEGLRESLGKLNTLLTSEGLVNAIEATAEAMVNVAVAAAEGVKKTATFTQKFASRMREIDTAANAWVADLLGINKALGEHGKRAGEAADEVTRLTEATEKHQAAIDRANRIEKEFTKSLESMRDIAKELGVALESDIEKQLEKNEKRLIQVENAARQGVITWEDYERISKALSGTNEELARSIDDVDAKVGSAAGSMNEYAQATERATNAQRGLGEQARATSRSLESAAGPLFPGLSGASYTYETFTPATLADLTYRGGGTFYRGREVTVLADGRIVWA